MTWLEDKLLHPLLLQPQNKLSQTKCFPDPVFSLLVKISWSKDPREVFEDARAEFKTSA